MPAIIDIATQVEFQSRPKIASISIVDGQKNVLLEQSVEVQLDRKNINIERLKQKIEAENNYEYIYDI